jgi:hypothetical protein
MDLGRSVRVGTEQHRRWRAEEEEERIDASMRAHDFVTVSHLPTLAPRRPVEQGLRGRIFWRDLDPDDASAPGPPVQSKSGCRVDVPCAGFC